jgi:dihydrofolate synthase/folylpolyglutamate synthase
VAGGAYEHTLAWLYRLEARRGVDLTLARVRDAAAALGHPERAAPIVHVAGTNGKGSTATMLAAMLRAGGRRVGLFTSPHLVSFRERIVVDGEPVTEDEVVEGVAHVRRTVGDGAGLTCFEMTTLLAWHVLAARRVDVAVLEVGLGGRLDATNVATPRVAVITNVGLDHEAYLGHDLASIAAEKAGIVKPGVPVVSGAVGVARAVIAARARALGSPLDEAGRTFTLAPGGDGRLAYRSPLRTIEGLELALAGSHQRANAALAIRALELAPGLTPEPAAVRAGLAAVRLPGRLQVVRRAPLVLLDGAHNPAGMDALVHEVRCLAAGRRVRVLFGVMRDKQWQGMLGSLRSLADELVLTRPRQPRSAEPSELAAAAALPVRIRPDPAAAYRELVEASGADDVVLVTGSLFLIGDVLPVVDPRPAWRPPWPSRSARCRSRPVRRGGRTWSRASATSATSAARSPSTPRASTTTSAPTRSRRAGR